LTLLKSDKKQLPAITRIIYFVLGLIIASALIVYAVSWNNLPFTMSMIGVSINQWVIAGIMVLIGIFASTLIKSALLGKTRLD
jgi:hypothetical protein